MAFNKKKKIKSQHDWIGEKRGEEEGGREKVAYGKSGIGGPKKDAYNSLLLPTQPQRPELGAWRRYHIQVSARQFLYLSTSVAALS